MLAGIISFLGQFTGLIIASKTKEELKQGEIYFKIIEKIILITIICFFSYYYFNIIWIFIGIILGFLFKKEYFYFGLGFVNLSSFVFLYSSLIFIYGLVYGSLAYYEKKKRILLLNIIWFFIPFALLFFNYSFIPVTVGALISILVKK